jgi:hypothetical protein
MLCIECDALLSEYTGATERYAALVGTLVGGVIHDEFQYPELQKLKGEIAEARLKCNRARKTLTAHRESQICSRYKILQTSPQPCSDAIESAAALGPERLQDRVLSTDPKESRGHSPYSM